MTIRPQVRDIQIMTDIGRCGIMTYNQIMRLINKDTKKLHFPSYDSCRQRISKLIDAELLDGNYFLTDEKVFFLSKHGREYLEDRTGEVYNEAKPYQVFHKLYRSDFYIALQPYNVSDWYIEASIPDTKRTYDATFDYNGNLHILEVHNEAKTKHLKNKTVELLEKFNTPKMTYIVYAKYYNRIKNMFEKLSEKGFDNDRRFNIKLIKVGDDIKL